MKFDKKQKIAIGILSILVVAAIALYSVQINESNENQEKLQSKYVGQETREIKALPQEEIHGLKEGKGTPFGGMAKPAELNGYPGPTHVLDSVESGKMELEESQKREIKELKEAMKEEAIELGEKVIEKEEKIDNAFSNKNMTQEYLKNMTKESAELYGQLRFTHLKYHLSTMKVLNKDQIRKYNEIRGYTESQDPCENIPEGHDPEKWKMHNNCN